MLKRRIPFFACFGLYWLMLGNVWATPDTAPSVPIKVGGSIDSLHDSTVTDAEIAFKLIFNELLGEINESFTVKIYHDDETLISNLKAGKIQAVFIDSIEFIKVNDLIHPTGRFVVQFGPTLKQRYLLLVRNKDKHITLSDLRGHKISMSTGHRAGKRFLDVKLLEQGLPQSEHFFSEVHSVVANTAVVDLYFGKVDMALVPEFSYELALELNPQIGNAVTVLMKSEPMIYQVVGMRYDFPQNRLDRIEPHMLEKFPSKRLERLLGTFHITHFYRATEDTLKEVRALDERYLELTRQKP